MVMGFSMTMAIVFLLQLNTKTRMAMETHADRVISASMKTSRNSNSLTLSTPVKSTSYRCSTLTETDTTAKNSVVRMHGRHAQRVDGERIYETTAHNHSPTSTNRLTKIAMASISTETSSLNGDGHWAPQFHLFLGHARLLKTSGLVFQTTMSTLDRTIPLTTMETDWSTKTTLMAKTTTTMVAWTRTGLVETASLKPSSYKI